MTQFPSIKIKAWPINLDNIIYLIKLMISLTLIDWLINVYFLMHQRASILNVENYNHILLQKKLIQNTTKQLIDWLIDYRLFLYALLLAS